MVEWIFSGCLIHYFVLSSFDTLTLRMLSKLGSVQEDLQKMSDRIETAYNTGVIDGFDKKSGSEIKILDDRFITIAERIFPI